MDTNDMIKKFVRDNWSRPYALIITLVFINIVILGAKKFELDLTYSTLVWLICTATVNIIIIIIWVKTKTLQKCPLNKVGLIFAIQGQDEKKYEELQFKFIRQIKELLPDVFFVQEVPYHLCKTIKDKESASELSNSTRSHMILYGSCVEGKRNQKEKFDLKITCFIRHASLNDEIQQKFQNDLNSLIPSVSIDKEDELNQYQLTSEWLSSYAIFFTAVAAYLSSDLELAQYLLEDLKEKLKYERDRTKQVLQIRERIDSQLYIIYVKQHIIAYQTLYRLYWRPEHLELAYHYHNLSAKIKPDTDDFFAFEAIYQFIKFRNVSKAKSLINKMSGKNATKSYSLAFLYAYEENIDRALELYKRAFRLSQDESLAIEVEEFIAHIVEIEPQQSHLYLLLAAINEFKGDIESAERDLQKFLDSIPVNEKITVKYIALCTRIKDFVLSNREVATYSV